MNPTYIAAKQGNTGGGTFLLADDVIRDERNEYQVTPKGNTALYGQSAHKGHTVVVRVLLGVVGGESQRNNKETLMRMTDDNGDTALHKAVRTGCVHTVTLLVQGDPEFKFPPNNAGETPLYLAAESGSLCCLSQILKYCKTPTHGGPYNRTPLHAAIIQKHMEHCPDYWEMLNSNGQNALHVAISNDKSRVVKLLLNSKESHNLIDKADNDGNTFICLLLLNIYMCITIKRTLSPYKEDVI
ncbi:hypothetical protein RDI58_017920 [Solanum bulbocastanum]|uniref:Uncharacterized protein n=1 Tax=Solanum bulbocastanum TaxID=147425 RepID=A0AAN8Y9A3_SOLBU